LLLHVGKARPVALLVDPDDAEIAAVAALGFPVLQLHGQESPDRVAAIRAATGCEVWKAFGVETAVNLALTRHYTDADGYLIDARPPKGAPAGGHGAPFDWSILDGWQPEKPWLLAGGLTPANVTQAIAQTGAAAVDVSSGVERIRGLKDKGLVSDFLAAAKQG
jgi:phosphoribosylanthranilate isomerase